MQRCCGRRRGSPSPRSTTPFTSSRRPASCASWWWTRGPSFFDTNTAHHQHFFLEETGRLVDVPGDRVSVSVLPPAPPGTTVSRIDIIIRVTGRGAEDGAAAPGDARTLE